MLLTTGCLLCSVSLFKLIIHEIFLKYKYIVGHNLKLCLILNKKKFNLSIKKYIMPKFLSKETETDIKRLSKENYTRDQIKNKLKEEDIDVLNNMYAISLVYSIILVSDDKR